MKGMKGKNVQSLEKCHLLHFVSKHTDALLFRKAMNRDVNTGPLARPFIRLLAHSRVRGNMNH